MKIPLIIFGFLYIVNCKQADTDVNYYGDDAVSDDYPYPVEESPEENVAPKEEKPVKITATGQTFTRNISDTVLLPCTVSGSSFVRVWRKQEAVLFQSGMRMGADRNMDEMPNGDLKIFNLMEKDGGEYDCSILISEKNSPKVTHKLILNTEPRIESLEAKGNLTEIKSGDTLTLKCMASGHPEPAISWHKDNKRLPTEGNVYTKANVKHDDAGQYTCFADNKIGHPAFEVVNIKVHSKPTVTVKQINVSAENDKDTELRCIVHSDSKADVVWKKDGRNIKNNKRTQLSSHKKDHILLIRNLEEQDFGVYTCSATNYVGSTDKNITLVKTPVIIHFIKPESNTKETVLTWQVQSKTQILKHEFQYRKQGEPTWKLIEPEVSISDNEIYTVKHTLTGLDPGTYETRIRSKNSHGWSDYSKIISFEGVHAKHGHHKSHKKGHRDHKEKHLSTQEIGKPTQPSLKSNEPAEHQENTTGKAPAMESDAYESKEYNIGQTISGCSSLHSALTLLSVAIFIIQIRPLTGRI